MLYEHGDMETVNLFMERETSQVIGSSANL